MCCKREGKGGEKKVKAEWTKTWAESGGKNIKQVWNGTYIYTWSCSENFSA